MLPDAIIIGDSHSNALQAGCAAQGLRVEMLRLSGNFWHGGNVFFHGRHGVWVKGLAAAQAQILALRERLGGLSLISPEVPIIAAMGYHLGRLVPPFGIHHHVTDAAGFAADPDSAYASQAMVAATVDHYRGTHIRMAQRMSRHGNMVLVTPPRLFPGTSYDQFAAAISARMTAAGVQVLDPSVALFGPDQGLPAAMTAEDGVHGNDTYGAAVVRLLLDQGLVKPRAA
jgi:hypothetical protein